MKILSKERSGGKENAGRLFLCGVNINMDIREIDYLTAKKFIKDKLLIVKPNYDYYGYFKNGVLAAACGIEFKKKYTRIHCNYTAPEHRNNGYITKLMTLVLTYIPGPVKGNCLETSVNIYKKLGFEVVGTKIYRGQTAYKMEMIR